MRGAISVEEAACDLVIVHVTNVNDTWTRAYDSYDNIHVDYWIKIIMVNAHLASLFYIKPS